VTLSFFHAGIFGMVTTGVGGCCETPVEGPGVLEGFTAGTLGTFHAAGVAGVALAGDGITAVPSAISISWGSVLTRRTAGTW
jgi:hypothetical protein